MASSAPRNCCFYLRNWIRFHGEVVRPCGFWILVTWPLALGSMSFHPFRFGGYSIIRYHSYLHMKLRFVTIAWQPFIELFCLLLFSHQSNRLLFFRLFKWSGALSINRVIWRVSDLQKLPCLFRACFVGNVFFLILILMNGNECK